MTRLTIDDFTTETTKRAPDRLLPQKAGKLLWKPMFAMAFMGFAVGSVLGIAQANLIASGGDPLQVAALGQYIPAAMFLGFASVFAAISFAIAKILGEFRVGGGSIQEAAHSDVITLKMPGTAKAFIAVMGAAMMLVLTAVILHVAAGVSIAGGGVATATTAQWTIWLEAARRFGVTLYLLSITLGLVTIARVIRFQTFRMREVAAQ